MSHQLYPEEFKIEAVKQVIKKGKAMADVAARLGMSVHCKRYSRFQEQQLQEDDQPAELRRL